jgi:AraC-type DNA-binding domain-containing proteins
MIEITIDPGDPVLFREGNIRKFRGLRLAGNNLKYAKTKDFSFINQNYKTGSWALSWRKYEFLNAINFFTRELNHWMRMEIVLSGTLPVKQESQKAILLRANQYHVTNDIYYQSHYTNSGGCDFLVVYISPQYLENMTRGKEFVACKPRSLPVYMRTIAEDILQCRYQEEDVRDFYYGRIWDLLFFHFQGESADEPDNLTNKERAAIYSADIRIVEEFNAKMTTRHLARMVGLPEHVLFRGFKAIFKMTPFERMMDRRLEHAAKLLITTDSVVMDIALDAGYTSLSAFGARFKRKFGMSPAEWRKYQKGSKVF